MEKWRKWRVIWWCCLEVVAAGEGSPGLGEASGWVILENRRGGIKELGRDEERWNDFESERESFKSES